MPEFILPAEADHCPHCGAVLRDPPDCCELMRVEHRRDLDERLPPCSRCSWCGMYHLVDDICCSGAW